jgi:hypothetical protein
MKHTAKQSATQRIERMVGLRLNPQELAELSRFAKADYRSVSTLARMIIVRAIRAARENEQSGASEADAIRAVAGNPDDDLA